MANTWLFQSTPLQFRLDVFFSIKPKTGLWLARQNAESMEIGDTVYLWQAIGKGPRSQSGILGKGVIASLPFDTTDVGPGARYWIDSKDANEVTQRVLVELTTTSTSPILSRDTVERNHYLKENWIFRSRTGTNFLLTAQEEMEIARLWGR